MALFKNEAGEGYEPTQSDKLIPKKKNIPPGLWSKCPSCEQALFHKDLKECYSVCPECDYHFIIGAWERIEQLSDEDSFEERHAGLLSVDSLEFQGVKSYGEKLREDQEKTKLEDACLTGLCKVEGVDVALAVTDSRFIMGSMGSVVGEKITRIIEDAIKQRVPLIIVSGSGGGARMYEGALSLMQMAKTSMALHHLAAEKLLFISVLTNPTMGGVMASFASLGDLILAEPKALIGFAGPRVIEQTIRQKLPAGFQTAEFLLEHGMVDVVVHRKELKSRIGTLLKLLSKEK